MDDGKMKKAIVLLSGGLDSTTTLAIAKSEGYEVYALSFKYGQRHEIELELASKNADHFKVKKHLTVEFNMRDIGGSALTDDIEVPKGGVQSLPTGQAGSDNRTQTEKEDDIPITYVPARNTIFLSFALAWAETLETGDIFIGANAVDYSGYPDCRPEYISAFEDMANLATKISVEGKMKFNINTPLIKLTKAEIIKKGMQLDVDYSQTWSCYDPVFQEGQGRYVPCLKCESCRLRAKGFDEAGIKDPMV
jgi:7-cyano-7-deazaguanine synthase